MREGDRGGERGIERGERERGGGGGESTPRHDTPSERPTPSFPHSSEKELQSRCDQLDRWLGALTSSMDEPRLVPNTAKFIILKFLHMR